MIATQANYKTWLGSDYLLGQLQLDPTVMQKRLGDGFFEQKLIREQVGQLTGRRFLDGYASEEAQYQALMASAVTVAQQWNLRPGIALTAEQMASLTSDMVWLVEQDVTFTDGRATKALVPVVYLSQVHTADLRPTGALISARSVDIHAKGDLSNNGALQAQGNILLAANKVTNELGLIDASRGATTIVSDSDIINRSGLISGNSVRLNAARDIRIDAVTRQFSASRGTVAGDVSGNNTQIGPLGSVVSRGDLSINAQRDVMLAGAVIGAQGNASISAGNNLLVDTVQTRQSTLDVSTSGVRQTQGTTNISSSLQTGGNLSLGSGGDTTLTAAQIRAGRDLSVISQGNLTINAATDTTQLDENMRAKGYVRNDHTAQERVIGSQLTAGGNVTLAALGTTPDGSKGNITVQGSSVNAATGQLNVVAANNVNIIEAREKGEYDLFNETKGSKTFSSKTQTAHDTGSSDIAVGSSLSGKAVNIDAGKDLMVRGSSVVSDNQTTLAAKNNVIIEAAQNSETSISFREEKKSGLMSSGAGFTVGKKEQSTDTQGTTTTVSASTVGSIAGNVNIIAGNQYTQTGSDVQAPGGNINILAKRVGIQEARETSRSQTEQKFRQSGVTLALSNPVVSAVQSAASVAKAVGETSNGRMQALGAATAAAAAKSAADALKAGQGTTINGKEGQIATKVDRNGNVLESRDATAADKMGGINVSVSIGSSKSQSNASSASDTARGSSINAGGNVNITATGAGKDSDLLIQGSTVKAGGAVGLNADDEIKLLAARNTSSQTSSNSSSSGSIGVSFGTSGLSANASASRASGSGNGSDTTYTNTRIKGNTVNVTSGGDTTLKGAVIAANQIKAKVGGKLDIESLQDSSSYREASKSSGLSISVPIAAGQFGGSVSAGKTSINSNYQSVAEQSGIKAGDGGFQVEVKGNTDLKGTVIASTDKAIQDGKNSLTTGSLTTSDIQNHAEASTKSSGINLSSDMFTQGKYGVTKGVIGNALDNASESGGSSGQTRSAVSTGAVTITNEAAQQTLTGKTAEQTVASLNRDTANAHTAAQKQDVQAMKQTVEAERAIKTAAFQQVIVHSDAAYKALFKNETRFYKVICGGTPQECLNDPSKVTMQAISQDEAKKDGKILAVNGILNEADRAGQLAYQNAPLDENDKKPDAITLMHIAPASTGLGELMVAGYEKLLAPTLGYSNADKTYADTLQGRGDKETLSLGHSRGTIVQTNALNIAADNGYENKNLTVVGVGGAVAEQTYVDAATRVTKTPEKTNFTYMTNDPVSVIAAGNPGDAMAALKEFYNVYMTSNSAHSCYGTGAAGCTTIANPVPGGPVPTNQQPQKVMTYQGGVLVAPQGNK